MGDFCGQSNLDETPLHIVPFSDFKIGKYEVTYRYYKRICQANRTPSPFPKADKLGRGNRAAAYVDWADAKENDIDFGCIDP